MWATAVRSVGLACGLKSFVLEEVVSWRSGLRSMLATAHRSLWSSRSPMAVRRRGSRSDAAVTELTSVDGIDLTYRTAGEAGLPVVVLLHALGENSSDWNAVVEALAPADRVYALDLRGHEGSSQPGAYSLELMRSDVLGFLHALDLDDVCLIRHSLGGAWRT